MHVEHLLQLESLGLTLLWGEEPLPAREIGGVTATDLEDPARFLQQGEVVLSGLVWWHPADGPEKAARFVAALQSAGAVALLAGEETHGAVPDVLVEVCRAHRVTLVAVPARTSFRAITEAVYLRQWGDLSRRPTHHYALPENVRNELSALLAAGADPDTLLDRAFAHLGAPAAYLLSATGRILAHAVGSASHRATGRGIPAESRRRHAEHRVGRIPLRRMAPVRAGHRGGAAARPARDSRRARPAPAPHRPRQERGTS